LRKWEWVSFYQSLSFDFPSLVIYVQIREIKVWDINTGICVRCIKAHSGWICSFVVSSSDAYVVSGGEDKTVAVWDLKNGQKVHRLVGHTDWVRTVCITHNQIYVISGSDDRKLKLWSLATGKLIRNFSEQPGCVRCSIVTKNDLHVITGCHNENMVTVCDIESGSILYLIEASPSWITCVAVSSHREEIISASGDAIIKIWKASEELFLKQRLNSIKTEVAHLSAKTNTKILQKNLQEKLLSLEVLVARQKMI